ncbi:MAG: cytidylate kinase-like family protein [Acidobacteria bacterium]|nr:cytidylate kinase-like family protein [Acidobacteriota bacterium]
MAIITISRGTMSGGMALAECLANHLGYPLLSREVLVKAAEKLGVSEDTLRGKVERSAGFWERMTSDRRIYLIALQSALVDAAVGGDLVYHGHAGHLLLADLPNVLRVRVIAPLAMRIREAMKRKGFDYEGTKEYIRIMDMERVRWTKFVYGLDWSDPKNYDLVINLGTISITNACSVIAATAKLPAYAATEDVKKKLRDFALACRVKVALAANAHLRTISFDVTADSGKVQIFAETASVGVLIARPRSKAKDIEMIAKTVEGVSNVRVDMRLYPQYGE